MSTIHQILKKHWGYSDFRPQQESIINAILGGNDTLALLPTGGGKSICFQVPAMALDGICIVVSPLVALMKDQVQNLTKVGIKAAAIYSGLSKREIDITLDNCIYGKVKFLYVSPERLQTEIFQVRLSKMQVAFVAVDEAHCISQWGYDFRPPYLQIAQLREIIPDIRFLALTASATPAVEADIIQKLEFKEGYKTFRKSFDRPNVVYAVTESEDKQSRILYALQKTKGSAIIYVRNRRQTRHLSNWLKTEGYSADFYHAGLTNADRQLKQDLWIRGKIQIIVCTNAFGMGIDKPNVRLVIHYELPDSLEAYYQEAGRAGRDGIKSFAIAVTNPADRSSLQQWANSQIPDNETIRKVYNALGNYLQIPLGSGKDTSKPFDIIGFSNHFDIKPALALNAIKTLHQQGVVELSDSFFNPSKVVMKQSNEALYKFMVANKNLEPFIKAILRTSVGVFDQFVAIKENAVAKLTGTTSQEVVKVLNRLNQLDILVYEQAKETAFISFLQNREESKYLQINKTLLEQRRNLIIEKAKKVIEFAQATSCRSKIMLNYFGELLKRDCGHCDVCLEAIKAKKPSEIQKEIEQLFNQRLEIEVEEFKLLVNVGNTKVRNVIKYMVDQGELLHTNGVFKLVR
ncbi:MAG: RecQ family ATP-dependent DNA helicase [Bacteroidetes bacterium]|nr:RecQ family ATP-dependent DNA helicase [Bacteroidota bacterium]